MATGFMPAWCDALMRFALPVGTSAAAAFAGDSSLQGRYDAGRRRRWPFDRSDAGALRTNVWSPHRERAAASSITKHHHPRPSSAHRFHGRIAF